MKKNNFILILLIAIIYCSCASDKEVQKEVIKTVPGIDIANLDTLISPKDDLYAYVNGTWLANNEIPSDRTRWGSFDVLRKNTNETTLAILKEAMNAEVNDTESVSDQQKVIYFFETIMDTVARDKFGIAPLQPYLEKIEAINSMKTLQAFLIEMEPYGGNGFIDFDVFTDLKNSSINVAYMSEAGLGLSRDYYVDKDEDTKAKREKYVAHIAKMLMYLGDEEQAAQKNAQDVLLFETSLATPRMTKEESRDARNIYNPMSILELGELTSEIDWTTYLEGIGAKGLDSIVVTDVNYFKALDKVLKEADISAWKNYLRWTLIDRAAGKLSTEIDKTNWEFYSQVLRGAKAQRKREERALLTVNNTIGEALGQLYVAEKFPPEAKEKAKMMIDNVLLAYKNRISKLTWMTPETKVKAIEKLDKMTVKIGYPDKWEDYSSLAIKSVNQGGTYFDNSNNITLWEFNKELEELGKEVDKSKWSMSPQTVNAYFNPVNNEIVFPAAILQPPFYNYTADEAVNYGGIGAVIGHEISHCFDDSGSRFDANGNLNNWWTDEDLKQFTELGKKLIAQYDAIEVLDSVYINGTFTLGENIGDLGGINAAYDGLQLFFEKNERPADIDGFTPEQRFYLSWATIWRSKSKEEALRNQIKTDPHSPQQYRAILPPQNTAEFHEAFEIQEGDGMYLAPEDRVKIW